MAGGPRYAAFIINYSRTDERLAAWLHRSLEAYRVPDALVGRDGPNGPIGKRLGSFSRAEGGAGRDLGPESRAVLDRSDALIVLRSPHSAQREDVNEQIRYFKSLGRGKRIMTAIVAGGPQAGAATFIWRKLVDGDERDPQPVDANGDVGDKRDGDEPIVADFRGSAHKRNGARLRIIASLLDIGLHELVQRERIAQRDARFAAAGAAAIVLSLSAGGLAWLSVNNTRETASESTQSTSEAAGTALLADQPEVVAPRPTTPAAPLRADHPVVAAAQSATPVSPVRTAQPAVAAPRPATPASPLHTVQPAVVAPRPAALASPLRTAQPAVAAPRPAAPASPLRTAQATVVAPRPAAPASAVRTAQPAVVAPRPSASASPLSTAQAAAAAPRPAAPASPLRTAQPAVTAPRPAAPASPPRTAQAAVVAPQPAAPASPPRTAQPAVAAPRPATPASPLRTAEIPPPSRQEPATQAAAVQVSAEVARPAAATPPQANSLEQLRELGAAQAVAVRCEGRGNQVSRQRANNLIASSPQEHQAGLIGAFNEGYRAAEQRSDACPVQSTAG